MLGNTGSNIRQSNESLLSNELINHNIDCLPWLYEEDNKQIDVSIKSKSNEKQPSPDCIKPHNSMVMSSNPDKTRLMTPSSNHSINFNNGLNDKV